MRYIALGATVFFIFSGIPNVVCAADCVSGDHRIDRKFAKPTSIVIFGIIFEERTDVIISRRKQRIAEKI